MGMECEECEEIYARQSFNNVSFPRAFPLSVIQNAFTDRLRVSCMAHRNIFISMHFELTMTSNCGTVSREHYMYKF